MVEWTGLGSLCKGRSPENVCGGGESELCQVMLAYTVISFFRKDSLFFKGARTPEV